MFCSLFLLFFLFSSFLLLFLCRNVDLLLILTFTVNSTKIASFSAQKTNVIHFHYYLNKFSLCSDRNSFSLIQLLFFFVFFNFALPTFNDSNFSCFFLVQNEKLIGKLKIIHNLHTTNSNFEEKNQRKLLQ